MPKANPKDVARSIAAHGENHPQDRAPRNHPNRAPQNHTSESPRRQADKPGAFGRHAVNGTHVLSPSERVYAEGIEVATKSSGRTVRVPDASSRRWETIGKQVRAGARVTVR